MNWQIFQDIMVGVACGSQPGIQGLPMLVVYEQQKKELGKLEEIKQAVHGQNCQLEKLAQNELVSRKNTEKIDDSVILDVLPADEIPYVYPNEVE